MKRAFIAGKLPNRLSRGLSALLLLIVPVLGYSQPAPPPGSGGSGTSPDTPLGVPFDADMNLVFAALGVVFALLILRRMNKKKVIA